MSSYNDTYANGVFTRVVYLDEEQNDTAVGQQPTAGFSPQQNTQQYNPYGYNQQPQYNPQLQYYYPPQYYPQPQQQYYQPQPQQQVVTATVDLNDNTSNNNIPYTEQPVKAPDGGTYYKGNYYEPGIEPYICPYKTVVDTATGERQYFYNGQPFVPEVSPIVDDTPYYQLTQRPPTMQQYQQMQQQQQPYNPYTPYSNYGYGYQSPYGYNPYMPQEDEDDVYLPETANQYSPIFGPNAKPSQQVYYQNGLNYNPDYTDQAGRPIPLRQPVNSYMSYTQQQQQYKEFYDNQQYMWNLVYRLTSKNAPQPPQQLTPEQQEAQLQLQKEMQQQQIISNQYNMLIYLSQLPNSLNDPNYQAHYSVRDRYIAKWNKIAASHAKRYPENMTLYQYLNEGYMAQEYKDMLTIEARKKAKELNRMFSSNAFRQGLAARDPNYNFQSGSYIDDLYRRREMALQDMTITLPPELKNTEYQQRRERFFKTIFNES